MNGMRKIGIAAAAVFGLLLVIVLLVGLALPAGLIGNLRDGAVIVRNGPLYPPQSTAVYKKTPTRPLSVHIFLPGEDAEPGASVILFHGGGFHSGWPDELFPLASALSKHGHSVFVPEYRLQRADAANYEDELADCRDAVEWVQANAAGLGADPERLVLGGSSAGAHLAAALVTLPRPDGSRHPGAIGLILAAPYLDSAQDSERFPSRTAQQSWLATRIMGKPIDVFEGRSQDYAPMEFMHSAIPPTRVMAGEHDRLWPAAQAFCKALRALGPECIAKAYPDAGHAFALVGYENHDAFVADVLAAIDQWLGPAWTPTES